MRTIPVSDLVNRINLFLHRSVDLSNAMVSGELSNVKYVNGHCYFDLKDENGQLSCTLWKSYAQKIGFRLEDGMAVLVHGTINVYQKRGSLQLSVDAIEQAGLGALHLQLERLKKELAAKGYFESSRKKPKPATIQKVGLVTGPSTAALQDVLKTIRTRWPMLEVHLFGTPVQGIEAPSKIVKALQAADQSGMDAILLVRGGGSFEDLFCFNDPHIVETLAGMKTYTVSGIGHEIDTSLADLAVDHRALTPTAAAQWVTLDQREIQGQLKNLEQRMTSQVKGIFLQTSQHLMHLQNSFPLSDPLKWIEMRQQKAALLEERLAKLALNYSTTLNQRLQNLDQNLIGTLQERLNENRQKSQAIQSGLLLHSPKSLVQVQKTKLLQSQNVLVSTLNQSLQAKSQKVAGLQELLEALSPKRLLKQGYAIVEMDHKPIVQVKDLKCDQKVSIRFFDGQALAQILQIQNSNEEK